MRKLLIALVFVLAIGFASWGVGYAISQLYKEVAGIGNAVFLDQVTVTDVIVSGQHVIRARLTSNAGTEADYAYTVALYLDSVEQATDTVTWSAPQIPGTTKMVIFSSLDLSLVTTYGVEVRR